jgi:hypothetical protein
MNDEDRDLGHLLRQGAGTSESSAEGWQTPCGPGLPVTGTDEVALFIFGSWPATNTNLLPVATMTWVYVEGVGRSSD